MPLLLAAVLALCLCVIPLGLPGTWLMLAAALGYNALVPGPGIGTTALVGTALVAVVAEVLEFRAAARHAIRAGGSRRAGWGAILGGFAGALVGVPVPIVGSVIGAFAGAFAGAYVAELTARRDHGAAGRVATGALIGRAVGAAIKVAAGVGMAAWLVLAAL